MKTQNETQNATTEANEISLLSYSEAVTALELCTDDAIKSQLVTHIATIESTFEDEAKNAKSEVVTAHFGAIKNVINEAKSIDLILEDLIYFLTDCESKTVNQYKEFLISQNRSFEQVKTLKLMNKKQIFKALCVDVQEQFRKALEGSNFFNKAITTAMQKDVNLICENSDWIIDLHFNHLVDTPKARLQLIQQIARNETVDSKSGELKIFNLETFKANGTKVAMFTKSDIRTLNTSKGRHDFYQFTASTLTIHLKEILDKEAKAIKDFEENIKKENALKMQEALRLKAIEDYKKQQATQSVA